MDRFFSELGSGSADEVADESGDDIEAEATANRDIKLFKVHGEGSDVDVTEVSGKPLTQGLLNQDVSLFLSSASQKKRLQNRNFFVFVIWVFFFANSTKF